MELTWEEAHLPAVGARYLLQPNPPVEVAVVAVFSQSADINLYYPGGIQAHAVVPHAWLAGMQPLPAEEATP